MGNAQSLCEEAGVRGKSAGGASVSAAAQAQQPTLDSPPDVLMDATEPSAGVGVPVAPAGAVPGAAKDPEEEEEAGEEAGEEEEKEEPKKTIELHTAPMDPRFPNANAARYCYTA